MSEVYLGKLCPKGHNHENTGKSVRYKTNWACIECQRNWKRDNPERARVIEQRRYWKDPKKMVQKSVQARRIRIKTDINFKLAYILRRRFKNVMKKPKLTSAIKLLGCSVEYFKYWLELQFTEGMNWSNYGWGPGKWVVDHVVRVANFDLIDPEEQKKCFHYTNLQPLWYEDNEEKG